MSAADKYRVPGTPSVPGTPGTTGGAGASTVARAMAGAKAKGKAAGKGPGTGAAEKNYNLPQEDAAAERSLWQHLTKWAAHKWAVANLNNDSLYIFKPYNPVRLYAWKVLNWKQFDRIMMALIVANCIFLAMFDPLSPEGSSWNNMLDASELVFTILFGIECLIQIVARCFAIGPSTYLGDPWRLLDFVVVVVGFIALAPGTGNLSGLRTARALKPLKTIQGVPGMRMLVSTLLDSIPLLIDILILLVWLFCIFGILGTQLWSGTFSKRCHFDMTREIVLATRNVPCKTCPVGQVCLETGANPNSGFTSFDNVFLSSLNIFHVMTLQGWSDILYASMKVASQEATITYFVFLVAFGAYFALSLMTAVISAKFSQMSTLERTRAVRAKKTKSWWVARLERYGLYRALVAYLNTKYGYQRPFLVVCESAVFKNFITFSILVNTGSMALEHHGMPRDLMLALTYSNYAFFGIFALEMALKIVAYGLKGYCADKANLFDAVIVATSVVEIVFQNVGRGFTVLRTFRVMRVFRSMKILRTHRGLRVLMETVLKGFGQLSDFLLVLLLFVFIFSILGMQLFGGTDVFRDTRRNFDSMPNALVTIFEMLTGSNWFYVMWNGMRVAGMLSSLFFLFWMFLGNFVLLKLFLAILIENFSAANQTPAAAAAAVEPEMAASLYDMGPGPGADPSSPDPAAGVGPGGLSKFAGRGKQKVKGGIIHQRIVRRRQRQFAKDTEALRKWLIEIGETYVGRGDDSGSEDENSEDDGLPKGMVPFERAGMRFYTHGVPEIQIDVNDRRQARGQRGSLIASPGAAGTPGAFQSLVRRASAAGQGAPAAAGAGGQPREIPTLKLPSPEGTLYDYKKDGDDSASASDYTDTTGIMSYQSSPVGTARTSASKEGETPRSSRGLAMGRKRGGPQSMSMGGGASSSASALSSIKPEAVDFRLGASGDGAGDGIRGAIEAAARTVERAGARQPKKLWGLAGSAVRGAIKFKKSAPKVTIREPSEAEREQGSSLPTARQRWKRAGNVIRAGTAFQQAPKKSGLPRRASLPTIAETSAMKATEEEGAAAAQEPRPMRRVRSRGSMVGQPGPVTEAFEGRGGGEGPALDRASDGGRGGPPPRGPGPLTVEVDSPSGRTPASTFRRASRAPSRQGSPGTSGPASPLAVNPALRRGSSMGAGTPGSGGGPPGRAGSTFLSTVASSTILLNMQQKIQAKRLQKMGIKPLLAEDLKPRREQNDLAFTKPVSSLGAKNKDGKPHGYYILEIDGKRLPRKTEEEIKNEDLNLFPTEFPVYMKHTSLFVFKPTSTLRRMFYLISASKKFEYSILAAIIVSSITLALDHPRVTPESGMGVFLQRADVTFTCIFLVEFLVKVIPMGFVMIPGSYLRNAWNKLDFFILITSVMSIFMNDPRLVIVKSFRLLRTLRPLRMVRRFKGMQLVVTSLIKSLPAVINVVFFGLFLFGIFGILGVFLLGGLFYHCNDPTVAARALCQGSYVTRGGLLRERIWRNQVYNFDNVFQAMLSLFVISTLDNWTAIAFNGIDGTAVDEQPRKNANPAMILYFIIFIVLASFFWVNLMVGIIIDQYSRIQAASGDMMFATEGQKKWLQTLKLKRYQNEQKALQEVPKFPIRKYAFLLATHPRFESGIMLCIVLNIVVMGTYHASQSGTWTLIQDYMNVGFTYIFILELVVKVIAYTPQGYFEEPWNRFDFVTVAASIPSLVGIQTGGSVFRVLKIGRMFKLIQGAKGLRALFNTFLQSLPAMANVGSLLFLLMFVFSVLGMNLFGELPDGEALTANANFRNFGMGLLTLFRVFTMDSWSALMTETMACDPRALTCGLNVAPPLFFIAFLLLGSMVLLNLIIAVILDRFVDSAASEGLLSTSNFFDAIQRKLLLDGFLNKLKSKVHIQNKTVKRSDVQQTEKERTKQLRG